MRRDRTRTRSTLPRLRSILSATCFAGALASTAHAETQSYAFGRTEAGHLTAPVRIGDQPPVTFLFDTGASHTAIAEPVAITLGYVPGTRPRDDVQALTSAFEADRYTIRNARLFDITPVTIDSVVLPADDGPLPIVGFLSPEALSSDLYALDFETGTLLLDPTAPDHADGFHHGALKLLFGSARFGGRGRRLNVMIDTGTARSFINAAGHALLPSRGATVIYNVSGVDPSDRGSRSREVEIRLIRIGGVCVRNLSILRGELDIFDALGWSDEPSLVIGMDLLAGIRLTVDREQGIWQLDPLSERTTCRGTRRIQRDLSDDIVLP